VGGGPGKMQALRDGIDATAAGRRCEPPPLD